MTPNKICEFCNCPLIYVPINIGSTYSAHTRILRVHYCSDCKAEYVYWSDDGIVASINLYTIINNKLYRWSVTPGTKGGRLWYVADLGIPGHHPNTGLCLLKTFKECPQLNPKNVEEKIRFMLLYL